MLMSVSLVVSTRSTCNRLSVGAVISREGRVLSTGYNGPPSGLPHCNHLGTDSCEDAVHAEANAVAFAARFGVATEGAEVYVTHSPCLACAKLLINAGAATIYFETPFRDVSGIVLLTRAGVRCFRLTDDETLEHWTGDGTR